MSNQDFFAASVNARRATLQREARASRLARRALRSGRRSARGSRDGDKDDFHDFPSLSDTNFRIGLIAAS